ncbi:MAG: sodium:alanine symporter family protein [Burkholderiaceae bacterium]|jgi:AGCS family alanine or glycine:cation symporter|nr:sodium:alanine symporter family protein [Burkholderiaceae bacterium]
MTLLNAVLEAINHAVWGIPLIFLLSGVGIYLSCGLRFMPQRQILPACRLLWQSRKRHGTGDITPFNALMTAMAAHVGTGNIAGVATAVYYGGPGALFWMWVVALIGTGTVFCETTLAVHFREQDEHGNSIGGPMYYIKNGLGKRWHWLAVLFALFGTSAAAGIGTTVQAHSMADSLYDTFGITPLITGIVSAILAGMVLLGGIRRIGDVAGWMVPFMAAVYVGACVLILCLNITVLPDALILVVQSAFTGSAATGGFAGATAWAAIRYGFSRGIFSNEAGMGSSPIAHASAQTDSPTRQGALAMVGVLIDTIVICTMTGLVIITTGAWKSGSNGAVLSNLAFNTALPGVGKYIVTFGMVFFSFSTLIGWSFYSEKCLQYLCGTKAIKPFRLVWVLLIPLGTLPWIDLGTVWLVADILNALMAVPNLIALVLLSPVLFRLVRGNAQSLCA